MTGRTFGTALPPRTGRTRKMRASSTRTLGDAPSQSIDTTRESGRRRRRRRRPLYNNNNNKGTDDDDDDDDDEGDFFFIRKSCVISLSPLRRLWFVIKMIKMILKKKGVLQQQT